MFKSLFYIAHTSIKEPCQTSRVTTRSVCGIVHIKEPCQTSRANTRSVCGIRRIYFSLNMPLYEQAHNMHIQTEICMAHFKNLIDKR